MSETSQQYIGRRVRRYRQISKLSQAELAKKANIPLRDYIHIENGEVEIGHKRFHRIIEAAGIKLFESDGFKPSVTELFGKNMKPEQDKFLQPLLKMEKDAVSDGMYWVDFLKEFFPDMAEIFLRMIEIEMYRRNSELLES